MTRIRGRALQKIRAAHFAEQPLCVSCEQAGRVSIAVELDHVLALCNGGADFSPYERLQPNGASLCGECHRKKTAVDLNRTYRPRVTIGLDGYPV